MPKTCFIYKLLNHADTRYFKYKLFELVLKKFYIACTSLFKFANIIPGTNDRHCSKK